MGVFTVSSAFHEREGQKQSLFQDVEIMGV